MRAANPDDELRMLLLDGIPSDWRTPHPSLLRYVMSNELLAGAWREAEPTLLPLFVRQHPGHRPFAWWLARKLKPADGESQTECLERLGELQPGEAARSRRAAEPQHPPAWYRIS